MTLRPSDIAAMRKAFGFSQRGLARAMRVAPFTVTRWETGKSRPVGLQLDVLSALHLVALHGGDLKSLGVRLRLGIGAFLAQELTSSP